MTCAVLIAQGYTAPRALRTVRQARWQALPNDRQLSALLDFERVWRKDHSGGPMHDPTALNDGPNRLGQSQPVNVADDVSPT